MKETLEAKGLIFEELNPDEFLLYKKELVRKFAPPNANLAKINSICVENHKYCTFLWHIFSYEFLQNVSVDDEAVKRFNNAQKEGCVLISNVDDMGYRITNAEQIDASFLNEFLDVTITDTNFSWTYSKTHEPYLGPYFYKK